MKNKHKNVESKQRFLFMIHNIKQGPKYKLICLGQDKEKLFKN